MSQTLPLNEIKWVKKTSEFNENFITSHNNEKDEGSFLEVDVQYFENLREGYLNFQDIEHQLQEKILHLFHYYSLL